MGCVSSVFQFGTYLVQEGAELNEDQKEETTSEKDGVTAPASPYQDTVTVASSGGGKIQESPTKTEAPLAREEVFTQQASPDEPKKEAKQRDEPKTGVVETPEPEVKELQRVNETKLEKEKTTDDTSGITTEKTVYTQVSESVTIQETKGPAVDPFSTSQKTVFPPFSKSWHESKPPATESQTSPSYVHSVKVTENSHSSPSSPASVSDDIAPPGKTAVHQFSESVPEKGVPKKSEEVEVATDVAEDLKVTQADKPESEKVNSAAPVQEKQQTQVEQEAPDSEPEVVYEEQLFDDSERSDVEGAVVKIQAGIRGYLTRKSLKESRKDGPMMQSPKGAPVIAASKEDTIPEEIQAASDALVADIGESDAAVKIQAMFRGYRTRKQLDELLNEPCDQEVEALNVSAGQTEGVVQESRKSPPDRSPVTVTENFVPILKAQVTITPPSSPTLKKEKVEVAPDDSKASAIPDKFGDDDTDETAGADGDDEDDAGKEQAATKIQAAFRGYKVRKISKKETTGKVEENLGGAREDAEMDLGLEGNVQAVNYEGTHQIQRDTPSPPLEPENEEDTLEDDAEDEEEEEEEEEIPSVQWQTSELYVDDASPKHSPEHDESKTGSSAEAATAPVSDSPKIIQKSSEQVLLSTAKISLGESRGSPREIEDQQMKSDH